MHHDHYYDYYRISQLQRSIKLFTLFLYQFTLAENWKESERKRCSCTHRNIVSQKAIARRHSVLRGK